MNLLSNGESNHKLAKSKGKGYILYGLSLRPHKGSGYNVCPAATKGCSQACVLEYSGHNNSPAVRKARDKKTKRFFEDRKGFLRDLAEDVCYAALQSMRMEKKCAIRLNVASDIRWENYYPLDSDVIFYDYTKILGRVVPRNYHLTYSFNERMTNEQFDRTIASGHNITVVFDTIYNPAAGKIGKLPTRWRGVSVKDGDTHDLRLPEFDGHGKVIGLRGKGGRERVMTGIAHGFIQVTTKGVYHECST